MTPTEHLADARQRAAKDRIESASRRCAAERFRFLFGPFAGRNMARGLTGYRACDLRRTYFSLRVAFAAGAVAGIQGS